MKPAHHGGAGSLLGGLLSRWARQDDPASRSYRYVARQLEHEVAPGEGGATVSLQAIDDDRPAREAALMLAHSLQSELDASVLLVDCALRSPATGLSAQLGQHPRPGLMELLADASRPLSEVLVPTRVEGVHLLPCGIGPAAGVLERTALQRVLAEARSQFRWVLLQYGSVLSDTRHLLLAAQSDAVFGVAVEQATPMREIERCDALLRDNGLPPLRVVLVGAER